MACGQLCYLLCVWLLAGVADAQLNGNPLVEVVNQLSAQVEAMKADLDSQSQVIADLKESSGGQPGPTGPGIVAFTSYPLDGAHGGHSQIHAHVNQTIPFEGVITNVGNAYNPTTSTFVAPVNGAYFFSISVDCSSSYADGLHVIKNGDTVLLDADKDDRRADHLTGAVVVELAAGDQVYLVHANSSGYIDTGIESTFSGILLK